jgi:hypothetical protein
MGPTLVASLFFVACGGQVDDASPRVDAGREGGGQSLEAPRCPTEFPVLAEVCTAPIECSYPDPCSSKVAARAIARCENGRWVGKLEEASCPASMPQDGSSCATCVGRDLSCAYSVGKCLVMGARCEERTGTWSVEGPPPREPCTP